RRADLRPAADGRRSCAVEPDDVRNQQVAVRCRRLAERLSVAGRRDISGSRRCQGGLPVAGSRGSVQRRTAFDLPSSLGEGRAHLLRRAPRKIRYGTARQEEFRRAVRRDVERGSELLNARGSRRDLRLLWGHARQSQAGSGIVMENSPSVNVLPLVTAWLALRLPAASRREFTVSTKAQCDAVPVAVTLPSAMAETITRRPLETPSVGLLTVGLSLSPSA